VLFGLSQGGFDARIRKGINLFRNTINPWLLLEGGHTHPDPAILSDPRVDGVLAHITSQETQAYLANSRLPVVNLSAVLDTVPFPTVIPDDAAIGRLAADHLLARGYNRLFVFSNLSRGFERARAGAFLDRVREAGCRANWFRWQELRLVDSAGAETRTPATLKDWFLDLPTPVAVYCTNDHVAVDFADVCRIHRLSVPDQVAILGTDNDENLCESASPPLSSIDPAGDSIGFEASRQLDAAMRRKSGRSHVLRLPPAGVVNRASTDATAVPDELVARGMRWLRDHAREDVQIADLSSALGLDRRRIERRFAEAGCGTPLQVLYRFRLEHCRALLLQSDLPVKSIAAQSGFARFDVFCRRFREAMGMSAQEYREKFRVGR
jgi:LacI family transcriptional regulator